MDAQRSPDAMSTQAENELICEKLLGWKPERRTVAGLVHVAWWDRGPGRSDTETTPSFSTWAEAGLILEALQARHERSFSLLTSLSTILKGGQLDPEDVRAAALVFIGSSS